MTYSFLQSPALPKSGLATRSALIAWVWLLMGITWIFFHGLTRFDVTETELLVNANFQLQQEGWRVSPRDAQAGTGFVPFSDSQPGVRSVRQRFSVNGATWLQTRATIDNVLEPMGRPNSVIGRVDLYAQQAGGKYLWFGSVGSISPENRQLERVLEVPVGVREVEVEAELVSPNASFRLVHLSIVSASLKPYRVWGERALLFFWAAVGGILSVAAISQMRARLTITGLVGMTTVIFAIITLLFIPASLKSSLQQLIAVDLPSFDHALLFFITGLVLFQHRFLGLPEVLTLAVVLELLQNFSIHRDTLLIDGLANVFGVLVAYCIYQWSRWMAEQFKRV